MTEANKLNRHFSRLKELWYLLSRAMKRARPTAIRNSAIHSTSKIEPGSQVVTSEFGRHSYCGYDCVFLNISVGVFCSVSDNVIVGGNSARVLRMRFSDDIITKLNVTNWWKSSDKDLTKFASLFNDPQKFLNVWE